ncbi:GtrA family protein [Pseudomonas reactans]
MIKRVLDTVFKRDFARFLMSGGFNTALTYGVYLVLLSFLSYRTSYTIAYVGGILLAYGLNRFFVFKEHNGFKSALLFPLVYLVQYLASLAVLWVWIEGLDFDERVGPLLAILITVPLTFVLSKCLFVKRPSI